MDVKAIPALIVGVMVAVVMVGAVLPVFADTTQAYDTFTNEGYFRVDSTDGDFSFSWDYDNPNDFVFGDKTLTFDNPAGFDVSVTMSDAFFIRVDKNNATVYFNGDGAGNIIANSTNKTLTVSRSGSTVSATNGVTTKTITDSSVIYFMSETGDWVMKNANKPAYMLADSMIFARGYSTLTGPVYTPVLIKGDTESVTITATNEDVTSITDIVIHTDEINSYVGLYSLDKITFTATANATDNTITFNYFVVPYEVTAERAVHTEGPLTILINVLPLMAVAGLLLGGVAWFVWKKG